jgi:hypothetical protein
MSPQVGAILRRLSDIHLLTTIDVTTSKCCDFTPIEHHHGFATVEVWVGRPGRNGGFLKGDEMRAAVWNMVGHLCPEKRDQCLDRDPGRCVYVDYVSKLNPFPVELKTGKSCCPQ